MPEGADGTSVRPSGWGLMAADAAAGSVRELSRGTSRKADAKSRVAFLEAVLARTLRRA